MARGAVSIAHFLFAIWALLQRYREVLRTTIAFAKAGESPPAREAFTSG